MTPEDLFPFCEQVQYMLDNGYSLLQINQWSYKLREEGKNIPYLSIADKEGKRIVRLWGYALKKNTELHTLFNEVAPGKIHLPRFSLYVELDGVKFVERKPEGKVNLFQKSNQR
jgi:hypothetical protein